MMVCVLNSLWDDVSERFSVKDIDPYFNPVTAFIVASFVQKKEKNVNA